MDQDQITPTPSRATSITSCVPMGEISWPEGDLSWALLWGQPLPGPEGEDGSRDPHRGALVAPQVRAGELGQGLRLHQNFCLL